MIFSRFCIECKARKDFVSLGNSRIAKCSGCGAKRYCRDQTKKDIIKENGN